MCLVCASQQLRLVLPGRSKRNSSYFIASSCATLGGCASQKHDTELYSNKHSHSSDTVSAYLLEQLLRRLNLLLACQEDEHIPRRLADVDLQRGHHRSVQVVRLGRLGVEDVHRVAAARDPECGREGATVMQKL